MTTTSIPLHPPRTPLVTTLSGIMSIALPIDTECDALASFSQSDTGWIARLERAA